MNNCQSHLKVGLDYHGVINSNPEYFRSFCIELLHRGHEVHVLSGGPEDKVDWYLNQLNIPYTQLFTIMDCYKMLGLMTVKPDGKWHIDEHLWNTAKAKYCRINQISVQIDDSEIYGKYFSTPYCLYNQDKQMCILSIKTEIIDLHTVPPIKTINKLEKLLKLKKI